MIFMATLLVVGFWMFITFVVTLILMLISLSICEKCVDKKAVSVLTKKVLKVSLILGIITFLIPADTSVHAGDVSKMYTVYLIKGCLFASYPGVLFLIVSIFTFFSKGLTSKRETNCSEQ